MLVIVLPMAAPAAAARDARAVVARVARLSSSAVIWCRTSCGVGPELGPAAYWREFGGDLRGWGLGVGVVVAVWCRQTPWFLCCDLG